MNKYIFSGHETFHCRHFWLKKGYDFLKADNSFNEDDAVVKLGVGKNMVTSIRFWLKAFDLVDEEEKPNFFADYLLNDNGKDPFLEDPASLWLLHYRLINKGYSSIYPLMFNDFLKIRNEFTKEHFLNFIKRTFAEKALQQNAVNENTVLKDFNVFLKNYLMPENLKKINEENYMGLFIDLNLVQKLKDTHSGKNTWYKIENRDNKKIPAEVILFAMLDQLNGSTTVQINKLLNEKNHIGLIFVLSSNSLVHYIKTITKNYPDVIFTEDAGMRVVQFKRIINKWDILNRYYEN
ncbi:MAG: DUF4007 family protein [Calditrichia bacterium]